MGEGFIIEVLMALNSYHQRSLLHPAQQLFTVSVSSERAGTLSTVEGGALHTVEGGALHTVKGGALHTAEGGALHTVEGGALWTVLVFPPQSNVSGSHHMWVS